jgi:uncharacterized protein
MIDLAPDQLEKVRSILHRYVPRSEVRVFGSRVNRTARHYSDLDLAVVGPGRLSADTLRHLQEAFEESDLPFRVDVLDWHAISPAFQKVIEGQLRFLRRRRDEAPQSHAAPASGPTRPAASCQRLLQHVRQRPGRVEEAAKAGATAIVQPGGSVRDADVIAAANRLGLAMMFTGVRHFRH